MASIGRTSNDEQKYRAPALEKGLDILELLASARVPLAMAQISSRLARSANELFRMVQVLEFRGYVEQHGAGDGFVLTNKLFSLGMMRAPAKDLLDAALPVMHRLSEDTGQSCHLGVASADQIVVVARVEAPGDLGFTVRIGHRRPLILATSGIVLYGFQPEPVREEWKVQLAADVSSAMWDHFEQQAEAARRLGHVRSESLIVKGLVDLSAPVFHQGRVVAALTCPYVDTPSAIGMKETIAAIEAAGREIGADLVGEDAART